MKTIKFFTYAFFVAILTLTSCSTDGEDGMDGMQGVPGEAGADGQDGTDGEDGTNGEDGTDGEDGNANVISSGWINYDDALWTEVFSQFSVDQRTHPVDIPDFTVEMADTAAILMYTRFAGTSSYILPFIENITASGGEQQELSFQPRRNGGGIDIRMVNTSLVGDPGTFGSGNEYRYVIIPAPSGRSANFSPETTQKYYEDLGVDFSNYESVIEYFNLK